MSTTASLTLDQYAIMLENGVFDGKHQQHVELVRGEIRGMNPIGTRHAAIVERINEWSFQVVAPERSKVRIQSTLFIPSDQSAPEPDVMWLAREDYSGAHPEPEHVYLLIEVAESSLEYDCGEKASLYARAEIRDYWVVDAVSRTIEVFRDPQDGAYRHRQTVKSGQTIVPLQFSDVEASPELFLVS